MASIRKKLVMVGDEKCGKRKLMESISECKDAEDNLVAITDYCSVLFETDNNKVNFDIVKTVYHDELMLRQYSYFDADLILIIFSIVNRISFKKIIDKWVPEVKHFRPEIPFVIIGCKKDLRLDQKTMEELKQLNETPISQDEGKALAKKVGATAYLECSALTNEGVNDILEIATKSTLQENKYQFRNIKCALN